MTRKENVEKLLDKLYEIKTLWKKIIDLDDGIGEYILDKYNKFYETNDTTVENPLENELTAYDSMFDIQDTSNIDKVIEFFESELKKVNK